MRLTSALSTSTPFRRPRIRLADFPVNRWLLAARARRTLPVPVVRNRLAAPRLLFILGMTTFSFPLRGPGILTHPHRAGRFRKADVTGHTGQSSSALDHECLGA